MAEPTDPITPEAIERQRQLAAKLVFEGLSREESAEFTGGVPALLSAARRSLEYEAFFREHLEYIRDTIDDYDDQHQDTVQPGHLEAINALLSRLK